MAVRDRFRFTLSMRTYMVFLAVASPLLIVALISLVFDDLVSKPEALGSRPLAVVAVIVILSLTLIAALSIWLA